MTVKTKSPAATEPATLLADIDPRAGPLIITIFGDAIAPHGGNIWLGSLIGFMAHFGISERLVRTVVFRLARDGWFKTQSVGRRSYYDLTPDSRKTIAEAGRRIYMRALPEWDGSWTLVQALPDLPAVKRQTMRENLKWSGFGQLSPTLMISPRSNDHAQFVDPGLADALADAVVFQASQQDIAGSASPANIAAAAWDLNELSKAYAKFIDRFSTRATSMPDDPADCFVLRTLLIHEYRRILLKDPQLPSALSPKSWPGEKARNLAATLYHALSPATDRYITENLECWSGQCPAPSDEYAARFSMKP